MPSIPQKRCSHCDQEFPATAEYYRVQVNGRLRNVCRECERRSAREWRSAHLEQAREKVRRWKKDNPERNTEHSTHYAKNHPEQVNAKNREWQRAHPEANQAKYHRRRARKRALPDEFTTTNWRQALDYWRGCCAYCGRPPSMFDLFPVLQQDHFVAQNSGGAFTPSNVLPACQSCNLSKGDSDPHQWLVQRFGQKRAKIILDRIQDYFSWVKVREQHY